MSSSTLSVWCNTIVTIFHQKANLFSNFLDVEMCAMFGIVSLSDMTMALIDAAHDKDAETKEVIGTALFELGKKRPLLVLSACHSYLKKHTKVWSKK